MAARGYLLAREGHNIDLPLAPRNAEDVVLDANQTAEQAARDVLRECLDQIATNIAVIQQLEVADGPHQLRIGLRRLRSLFSVFSPVLECPEMCRLSAEARWLGQEVGRLRDLDVVANEMVRPEAQLNLPSLASRRWPASSSGRRGNGATSSVRRLGAPVSRAS
jgi:inorganic triphosphatase YgiF